jgi:hypothetical protein
VLTKLRVREWAASLLSPSLKVSPATSLQQQLKSWQIFAKWQICDAYGGREQQKNRDIRMDLLDIDGASYFSVPLHNAAALPHFII